MHESRMMAEVCPPGCCAMVNVSGRRIATPFAPPTPGSTPMMTPSVMPASISSRLNHERATWKPPISEWISCIAPPSTEAQGRLERTLRQRNLEPDLEHHEERHHHRERHRDDVDPPVLAEVAHEGRDEEGRGNVDPQREPGV